MVPRKRVTLRVTLALLLQPLILPLSSSPASAVTCSGSYGNVSAINNYSPTYGSRMDAWVYDFGQAQFETWRSITVWQNPNNFAEVGWVTSDAIFSDQNAHPYKTRKNNGTLHTIVYPSVNITPLADFHRFIVRDTDDDNYYSSSWDGNVLDSDWFVTVDASVAMSQVQSERACNSDSLSAKFQLLKYWDVGTNLNDWANKYNNGNYNNAPICTATLARRHSTC